MKQLIFLLVLVVVGSAGALLYEPFLGVAVYYLFAVLRPQYIWDWALDAYIPREQSQWSFWVAIATILAAILQTLRLVAPVTGQEPKQKLFVISHAHLALLAFFLVLCMSFQLALDPDRAYPWFLEYTKIFVMIFASSIIIQRVGQLWALLIISGLSMMFLAYEVNIRYLMERRMDIYFKGYGGLDNNGAGLMFAMGVPICLFLWEGSQRWWRWVFAAFIPVMIHAMLLSFSRGAMVALLLVSPLFFLRSREKGYLSLAYIGLAMLAPLMAGPELQKRFFSIEEYEKDQSAQARFQSWGAAYQIASDYPFFGVGPRNSNMLSYAYGADAPDRTIHSQFLQLAADCGFIGLTAYLAILWFVWRNTMRTRQLVQYRDDSEARQCAAVASAVECSLAVFCIGGIFLSLEVFELPYLLVLLGAQLPLVLDDQLRQQRAVPIESAASLPPS